MRARPVARRRALRKHARANMPLDAAGIGFDLGIDRVRGKLSVVVGHRRVGQELARTVESGSAGDEALGGGERFFEATVRKQPARELFVLLAAVRVLLERGAELGQGVFALCRASRRRRCGAPRWARFAPRTAAAKRAASAERECHRQGDHHQARVRTRGTRVVASWRPRTPPPPSQEDCCLRPRPSRPRRRHE